MAVLDALGGLSAVIYECIDPLAALVVVIVCNALIAVGVVAEVTETEVTLDANNRMLLPKRLMEYAGIEDEVVLAGQSGKIEIWASDQYGKVSAVDDDFAAMAEKILGGSIDEPDT